MQTESSPDEIEDCPHKIDHDGLTCDGCGKSFEKPILAQIVTTGHAQSYQACPHCMAQIKTVTARKSEEKKSVITIKETAKPEGTSESNVKCGHSFGYLNKRKKGAPVPEQCLTCAKMVDCLYG